MKGLEVGAAGNKAVHDEASALVEDNTVTAPAHTICKVQTDVGCRPI